MVTWVSQHHFFAQIHSKISKPLGATAGIHSGAFGVEERTLTLHTSVRLTRPLRHPGQRHLTNRRPARTQKRRGRSRTRCTPLMRMLTLQKAPRLQKSLKPQVLWTRALSGHAGSERHRELNALNAFHCCVAIASERVRNHFQKRLDNHVHCHSKAEKSQ